MNRHQIIMESVATILSRFFCLACFNHTDFFISQINNPDNYCLFYALVATLMFNIAKMTDKTFFNYLHSRKGQRGRLYRDVMELMKAIGAPMNLSGYRADVFVPRVLDYW